MGPGRSSSQNVDKIKIVFDGLMRATKQMYASDDYCTATWDFDSLAPPIGDSFMDAMDNINAKFEEFRTKTKVRSESRFPPTIQHATAEVCLQGADLLSRDTTDVPAADLLQRYGQIQAKLGEARMEFNHTLNRKFIEPFSTYAGAYDNANARLRAIRGAPPANLQSEVDLLEKEFSSACEEAIGRLASQWCSSSIVPDEDPGRGSLYFELNEFWKSHKSSINATFLVQRTLDAGGFRIAVVGADELLEGEEAVADCYSLQIDNVSDFSMLAAVNKKLVVEPGIMMPNTVFVDPTDQKSQMEQAQVGQSQTEQVQREQIQTEQVQRGQAQAEPVQKGQVQMEQVVDSQPKVAIANTADPIVAPKAAKKLAKTVIPAKSKPKKSSTSVANKKGKNASVKKLAVDLKSKLKSDIFSADETETVLISASESDSAEAKDLKLANQSFVTFSSGDEEQVAPVEPVLEDEMQIDETPTIRSEPTGPKMKAIKVPKTFMENGYLVTEMITEMVPVDENSSSQEQHKGDSTTKKPAAKNTPTPENGGKKQDRRMYWPSHSNQTANLDGILERGLEGLDDLLDQDNIILRTRNGDEKVLAYLGQEATLGRLLEYAMGHGLQGEKGTRYPLIACELICSEHSILFERLQEKDTLLDPIWQFPRGERPMAPFLVCWSRVLVHLMGKIPKEISNSLRRRPEVVNDLMLYLGNMEVCDVLFRLFSLRTEEGEALLLGWLIDEQIIFRQIFDTLKENVDSNIQISTLNVIIGFLSFPFPEEFPVPVIVKSMVAEFGPVLERSIVEDPDVMLFACVTDIFCQIVVKIVQSREERGWPGLIEKVAVMVNPFLSKLHALLSSRATAALPQYQSPSGPINPVGLLRLKAVKLFSHVMYLQNASIVQSILSLGTANSLLHNNLLHSEVFDFLRNIFTGNYEIHRLLIVSIFKECKLTARIVKTQRINDSIMQRPRGNRLGHMGHITMIGDQIVDLLERQGEELGKELATELEHEDWQEYCELSYRDTKIKDALVLGGSKAPPPPPNEDIANGVASFTGLFATGTEEQLARYFCQQVIASLPNRFVFSSDDSDTDSEGDSPETPWNLDGDDYEGEGFFEETPSIEIPVEGNGFDNLLEMEMRISSLGELSGDPDEDDSEPETEAGVETGVEWNLGKMKKSPRMPEDESAPPEKSKSARPEK
ncbi:SIT4 phosphatase-associated protein family domain-containing protein [Paramicrosporidium saccamoebae]|uniref:SIT4 phosphatase-associated protein family domain-containing protein n=1 Tax=Paramicrosporidium saccamoebae TaxID=1246581 RepID=A0A2H9TLX7_9FUNG|nr:SIT4 phosphatase-associated protein family domain-containing protein [Paramicrosporidium saccamoebae]